MESRRIVGAVGAIVEKKDWPNDYWLSLLPLLLLCAWLISLGNKLRRIWIYINTWLMFSRNKIDDWLGSSKGGRKIYWRLRMLDWQSRIFDWRGHQGSGNLIGECLRKGEARYTEGLGEKVEFLVEGLHPFRQTPRTGKWALCEGMVGLILIEIVSIVSTFIV